MKPSFALTLSHDSIGLLHRTPNGWLSIGSVAVDDPDLSAALDYLRRTAMGLEPQGFATKVVIPNSEILYDMVRAPGPKPAQRRAQIAAAIEGRTPYTLDELTFDWSGTGEDVHVALVARETLAEAEAFATEHGFNPVSFVAIPDPGGFAAEPWFGRTSCAADLLAPGEKLVRDQDPIRLVQRTPPKAPGPETPPEAEDAAPDVPAASGADVALADPFAEPESADLPSAELLPVDPVSEGAAPVTAAPDPVPDAQGAPAAAELATVTPPTEPEAPPAGAAPQPAGAAPQPDPEPPQGTPAAPQAADDLAVALAVAETLPPDPAPPPPAWLRTDPPAAPPAKVAPPPVEAADTAPDIAPPPPAPTPPDDGDQTRAWPGEDDALTQTQAALAASLAPPPVPAQAALVAGFRRESDLSDLPPPVSAPVQRVLAAARAGRDSQVPRLPDPAPPGLTEKMQKAISKATKGGKSKPKPPAPRPAFAPPPPPLPPSASQPHVPPAKSEQEKMTVFGERRASVGGKPRFLGLILTGILLLVLIGVAVWVAMVLDPQSASRTDGERETAALAPPEGAGTAVADLPGDSDLPAPVAAASSLPADPAPGTAVEPEAAAAALPDPAPVTPEPDPAPVAEAPGPEPALVADAPEPAPVVGTDSSTVAAALPANGATTVGDIAMPRADPALAEPQRMRLADLPDGAGDPAPSAPGGIQEFGALYQFDAEGNILPTPDGVITPDGVRLVAGRPDRAPPPRPVPAEPAPQVAAAPEPPLTEPAPPTAAAPTPGTIAVLPPGGSAQDTAAFQPDAAAPRRRPTQRPAALVVPAPAAIPEAPVADEGALPATAGTGFASRRPPARPASAITAARSAEADRAREVAAAAAAAAASASTALAEDTPGLAATRRPAARPANFARAVEAAVAAAITPPVATPRAQPAAAPEEPVAAAARGAPTRASVARQATVTGALNLGRTNLIGVFGTANARYALVRESGGRLVRVKVGDRVDGGRVTAIGASELRYQRGSQTLRLEMPRG